MHAGDAMPRVARSENAGRHLRNQQEGVGMTTVVDADGRSPGSLPTATCGG